MFAKLTAEQISDFWNVIKFAVSESLPPVANEAYDKMNRILEALMNESMQCWVSYRDGEGKKIIEAIVVTSISGDVCSDTKNLFIYSLYGFDIAEGSWEQGFSALSKWAKAHGCVRIVAYTDVDRIKEMAKQFGGEARYTLVSVPL